VPRTVPILMYHHVAPEWHPAFRKYTVTPGQFAEQLRWLRSRGYESVDLGRVARWIVGSEELPARAVVVTFDDGFSEAVAHAVPLLKAHGFSATFFVVAGLVGTTSDWLVGERGFALPLADWETLRAIQADGFAVGSHAMTHPRLATLAADACRAELNDARAVIARHVGGAAAHLAYPFGNWDDGVRACAREAGYVTACTTDIGLTTRAANALSLPRVPVLGTETLRLFAWRLRLAHAPRDLASRLLARSGRFFRPRSAGGSSA
jgi:peptidoglycan/xylan/chitin deacetylase (PgdA/CDA1 family)